jgi:hypothetical protein
VLELVDQLDDQTQAIYLQVPGEDVVKLQAFFEQYEGLGIVRTLSIKKSLIAIITTPSMLNDCFRLLEDLKEQIPWTQLPRPEEAVEQLLMGYFKKVPSC